VRSNVRKTTSLFIYLLWFQAIDDIQSYVETEPSVMSSEKEHVLVAMKLEIGGRRGILLLDPGYHVARVVTVMRDTKYPHTGMSKTIFLLTIFSEK